MREIKFRGKLISGRGWAYGNFQSSKANGTSIEVIGNIHDNPELLKGD